MHHYEIARSHLEQAVEEAEAAGWSTIEVLQSLMIAALERYVEAADPSQAKRLLEFELANLSESVDYDFVRSR